jgi:DNA invertase Pin-like site-specific DNA recombinase
MLDYARPEDTVVVAAIDRLGRTPRLSASVPG